jgi:hypothetical protein
MPTRTSYPFMKLERDGLSTRTARQKFMTSVTRPSTERERRRDSAIRTSSFSSYFPITTHGTGGSVLPPPSDHGSKPRLCPSTAATARLPRPAPLTLHQRHPALCTTIEAIRRPFRTNLLWTPPAPCNRTLGSATSPRSPDLPRRHVKPARGGPPFIPGGRRPSLVALPAKPQPNLNASLLIAISGFIPLASPEPNSRLALMAGGRGAKPPLYKPPLYRTSSKGTATKPMTRAVRPLLISVGSRRRSAS